MKKKIDLSDLIKGSGSKKKRRSAAKTAKKEKEAPVIREETEKAEPAMDIIPEVQYEESAEQEAAEDVTEVSAQDVTEESSEFQEIQQEDKEIDNTREFVSFLLSNEEYGVDSDFVRQIIKYKKPLDVGIKSELIFGVLNLKDGVLPLVDFRKRFNLNMKDRKDGSIIILDLDEFRVGIYVDYLIGIVRLKNEDVKPVPPFLPEKQMVYVKGAGLKKDGKIIIILDQYRLFNDTDVRELKSVPERYK